MMNYSGPDKKNSGSSFDNQDFGIYDAPDDLLKAHHQEMSPLKTFLYRHLGRHLMNRNVKKIRHQK